MVDLPLWLEYLLKGIVVFFLLAFAAVAASRAGRNPYYALLLLMPVVQVVIVWLFAFTAWPHVDRTKEENAVPEDAP